MTPAAFQAPFQARSSWLRWDESSAEWGGIKMTRRVVIMSPFWDWEGFLNCPGLRSCARSFLYRALGASNGPWASARRWSWNKNKITIAFKAQRGREEEEEREKEGSLWALIARWWIFSLPFNGALIAGLPGGLDALISVAEDPDPDYPPSASPHWRDSEHWGEEEEEGREVKGFCNSYSPNHLPIKPPGPWHFWVSSWKGGDSEEAGWGVRDGGR